MILTKRVVVIWDLDGTLLNTSRLRDVIFVDELAKDLQRRSVVADLKQLKNGVEFAYQNAWDEGGIFRPFLLNARVLNKLIELLPGQIDATFAETIASLFTQSVVGRSAECLFDPSTNRRLEQLQQLISSIAPQSEQHLVTLGDHVYQYGKVKAAGLVDFFQERVHTTENKPKTILDFPFVTGDRVFFVNDNAHESLNILSEVRHRYGHQISFDALHMWHPNTKKESHARLQQALDDMAIEEKDIVRSIAEVELKIQILLKTS